MRAVAVLGGEVAVGDLGGGERQDALDEGEVALAREVGAGGVDVGHGGQFAVADGVARAFRDGAARVRGSGSPARAVRTVWKDSGSKRIFGVGEVAVVEEEQGGALADRGRLGPRDVGFDAVAQGEAAFDAEVVVVEAHGDAGGGRLPWCSTVRVWVVGSGGEGGGEGVDAGGAQPGVGPGVDVAFGGGGEVVDEVGEGGVGELVAGEVGCCDAGQEVLLAEPGDELAQGGGALGVGDAVEVEHGGRGVGDGVRSRGDGVGGGTLVGVVAPGFAGDAEVGPGVGEASGFGEGLVVYSAKDSFSQMSSHQRRVTRSPYHVGHFVGDDHGAADARRSVSVTAER